MKNTGLISSKTSFVFFGALVSWSGLRANPQAYGPLDSTRCSPGAGHDTGWEVEVAGRAASFPRRAGRDRTGEKRGAFPPPGVIPQAAGRRGTVGVVVSPPLARGVGGVVLSYFMSLALSPEGGVSVYAGSVRVRLWRGWRCDRACACVRAWAQARRAVWAYGVVGGLHRQFERSVCHIRRPYEAIDGGEDGAKRERRGVREVAAAEARGRRSRPACDG